MTGLSWPATPPDDGIVCLDRLHRDDAEAVVASIDDEAIRWLPLPDPYLLDDAVAFLESVEQALRDGTRLTFAIRPCDSDALLGTVSLQLEGRPGDGAIGYAVAPSARRTGVARRATLLAAAYGFDALGLHRIEILVRPDNLASRAVARACGAVYEGVRRDGIHFVASGQRMDAAVYALLSGDMR